MTVSCTEVGGETASPIPRLRIAISDTGPGIAPQELGRLFTLFERLGAEAAGVVGTGAGLTLSKGLVEAMSGTLAVQSVVGEGSTFCIELPLTGRDEAHDETERGASKSLAPLLQETRPETRSVVFSPV